MLGSLDMPLLAQIRQKRKISSLNIFKLQQMALKMAIQLVIVNFITLKRDNGLQKQFEFLYTPAVSQAKQERLRGELD